MCTLIPASPTKWSDGEVTKILNAQYIKWGASSVSVNVVCTSTSFDVDLFNYETKERVGNVSYEVRVKYTEEDEIVPDCNYERTVIESGPQTIQCNPNGTTNIRIHVNECSQRRGYLVFCVGAWVESDVVFSPPFIVGTKSRSLGKHPTVLSVSWEYIWDHREGGPKKKKAKTQQQKTHETHEALFATADSESDSSSSDDEDDDEEEVEEEDDLKEYLNSLLEKQTNQLKQEIQSKMDQMFQQLNTSLTNLREQIQERQATPSSSLQNLFLDGEESSFNF